MVPKISVKILLAICLVLQLVSISYAASITRDIQTFENDVSIQLSVNFGSARFGAFEEIIPSDLQFVEASNGGRFTEGKIRWIFTQKPADTVTLTYKLHITDTTKTYAISGTYMLDGMSDAVNIIGDSIIGIQNENASPVAIPVYAVAAIIVLVIIGAVVVKSKMRRIR